MDRRKFLKIGGLLSIAALGCSNPTAILDSPLPGTDPQATSYEVYDDLGIQEKMENGARHIVLPEGDITEDVNVPDEWDGVIQGVGAWFNTRIRGRWTFNGWGRYTLDGLHFIATPLELPRIYLGTVRDVVVSHPGSRFQLGVKGVNASSACNIIGLRVTKADGFEVYAADTHFLGGAVERMHGPMIVDGSADFGGITVENMRFEHDDTRVVQAKGNNVHFEGGTHILTDLEAGEGVTWERLTMVMAEVHS